MEETIKDYLTQLIGFLTTDPVEVEVEIVSSTEADEVRINIQAPQAADLIGRGGATIEAIRQMVLLKILSITDQKIVRVKLDINAYYQKQDANLLKKIEALAAQVTKTKQPVRVRHLTPRQRRLVHLHCQNQLSGVTTHSEDEAGSRVLVIAPSSA